MRTIWRILGIFVVTVLVYAIVMTISMFTIRQIFIICGIGGTPAFGIINIMISALVATLCNSKVINLIFY